MRMNENRNNNFDSNYIIDRNNRTDNFGPSSNSYDYNGYGFYSGHIDENNIHDVSDNYGVTDYEGEFLINHDKIDHLILKRPTPALAVVFILAPLAAIIALTVIYAFKGIYWPVFFLPLILTFDLFLFGIVSPGYRIIADAVVIAVDAAAVVLLYYLSDKYPRNFELMPQRFGFGILGSVFISLGLLMILAATITEIKEKLTCSCKIKAICIDINNSNFRRMQRHRYYSYTMYQPVYKYYYKDATHISTYKYYCRSLDDAINAERNIFIDPDDPGHIYITADRTKLLLAWVFGLFLSIPGAVFFMISMNPNI